MKDCSDRILELRRLLGINQNELGNIAGVTKSAVSQWERGLGKPNRDALIQLRKTKNINTDWVINGVGTPFFDENNQQTTEETVIFQTLSEEEKAFILELRKQPKSVQSFLLNSVKKPSNN